MRNGMKSYSGQALRERAMRRVTATLPADPLLYRWCRRVPDDPWWVWNRIGSEIRRELWQSLREEHHG